MVLEETPGNSSTTPRKIREHSLGKTPVIAVVGRQEAEQRKLALRRLGAERQSVLTLDEAIAALTAEALPPDLAAGADSAAA